MNALAWPWPPPDSKTPLARGVVQIEKTYGTSANDSADPQNAQVLRERLPQFTSRRRFCVWAVLAGFAPPERLTERIIAELEERD
ncbi:MAG TPA: hypothetical protein VGQ96_00785 [Candidatus Eremiobacteraceae bacterium]|nr:hypothetical protein [Candidatus Eremiobacteraceae bacterium]